MYVCCMQMMSLLDQSGALQNPALLVALLSDVSVCVCCVCECVCLSVCVCVCVFKCMCV